METYHIHISGIVQGVGFRPFIYQLAQKYKLCGWVNNSNNGVHIEIGATSDEAKQFYQEIITHPPKLASITSHNLTKIARKEFHTFAIIESEAKANPSLPLTPDFALCADCRAEIDNPTDRRMGYAFTTCTNCGPRYSIITELPYDRPHTTMAEFAQCEPCSAEYHNPLNRRHYSQTNSCPDCGIELAMGENKLKETLNNVVELLQEGKIIAIKGIGGYLLMCDATNREAINLLRERKHRPTKPFAVMYPDIAAIKKDFDIGSTEEEWFTNEVSPIILLKPKAANLNIVSESIAPGLGRIGCMIPYAPLFHLILQRFKNPVVATSGNISGSPIIYQNSEANDELSSIADAIITNNRAIVVPQDDSVISFSPIHKQKIILRRSRGLAPTFLDPGIDVHDSTILAVGAQMKSSFTTTNKGLVYVSQYLGDMDNYLTQEHYEKTVAHFFAVFGSKPEAVLGDLHPGYFSTTYAMEMAKQLQVDFKQIQHHKAHFYAILAENKLLEGNKPILGVVWDGTGYGEDGQVWGGEFFVYEINTMARVSHIPYFPFILGDKMPREPRISALAINSLGTESDVGLDKKFTSEEWAVYNKLISETHIKTSSMGRLFDAIASMVLNINKTSYEGEAAMLLEAAASTWFETNPIDKTSSYEISSTNFIGSLVDQVIDDKRNNVATTEIAAKFHISLVNLIQHEANNQGVKKIAFSGGVFQNNLLVDLIITLLQDDFHLYFHQRLSANDENISFGQLAWFNTH